MDTLTSHQIRGRRSSRLRSGVETFLQIILVYATSTTVIHAGEVPRFLQQPQSAIVKESTKVSLRCKASPEGSSIHWLFNGKKITSNSETGIDIQNGRLVIRSFQRSSSRRPSHEGVYQCIGSNDEGSIISLEASLEAAYIGDFYEGPQDHHINVTEGNVAYIPCAPISGRPRPHVYFELNGTALDTTPERFKVMPSGTLQIGNVRSRDRGLYRCLANNLASDESKRAKRIVDLRVVTPISNHPPVFNLVPPQEVKVIRGDNLTLECVVEGAPVPVVTWSKYGGKLPENRYRPVFGNLELFNVGRLDEGTYICNTHNGIGPRQVAIAQVDVLEKASIQSGPTDQRVAMGTSASFQCHGRGKPAIIVQWFHNGKVVKTGSGIISINDTTLIVNQVRPHHEGIYQCIVKNSLGGISASSRLSIVNDDKKELRTNVGLNVDQMQGIAPDMDTVHHLITTLPQNTTILAGGATVLPCGTNQDQVEHGENFLWLRNSITIESLVVDPRKVALGAVSRRGSRGTNRRSQLRVLPSGSLQIINAQPADSGEYTCVLWIDGNSDTASAFLTVMPLGNDGSETPGERNRPDENPTPGGDTGQTPMSHLGRRSGNKRDPEDDVLEISDDRDPADNGGRRKANRRRGHPSGQDAAGDAGNGNNNGQLDGELIPPSRPQVTKLSDTSVMLEWSVPDAPGLAITFFKVQYKEMVADRQRRRWRTIDEDIPAHVRRFEVAALKPGCTYRFRIVGVYSNNDNKHGPNSRKFTMETPLASRPKVPLMGPVIVEARPLSPNAIALKWQYLPEKWMPLEGFTIYYHIYSSNGSPQKLNVMGSHVRETRLEPLLPNTMYAIRMKGYNMGGESEFSNTVVQSTISPSEDGEFDYDVYPGFDGDFHINGQPMPTNWPELVPKSYKPSTEGAPVDQMNTNLSTEESSRMMYIVLGCVLGIMVIFLLFFMAMCAWKQRQRTQMLATLDGRNKFEDQSRAIYTQDSMRHKQVGNGFLLNGLNTPNGNGAVTNGHVPGYTYPHMNITSNPMTDGDGQRSPTDHHHDHRDSTGDNAQSLQELRASLQEMLQVPPPPPPLATGYDEDNPQHHPDNENMNRYEANMSTFGRDRSRNSHHMAAADHLYDQPPEYHSIGSRRSNVPDHRPSPQLSLRSQTSSSYRVHDPHLTDHIPRSHDRPHYRRPEISGNAAQGEADRSSEHSHSSSSQVSTKHKRRRRKPVDTDDYIMKDQSTNTDNENTLPSESPVRERLHASPSDHRHSHSNQPHHHGSHSHPHGNHHHYGSNVGDEPHYGNHRSYHDDPSQQDGDHILEYGEGSSDEKDYEILTDSSPPPSYQSPNHSHVHGDAAHLHGNQQYSDESLPDAPPTPPQLPRMQDYPQTDPED